jgi:hypothetical protein
MRNPVGLAAFAAVVLGAACTDVSTRPTTAPQFSKQIAFGDLQNTVSQLSASGATRVRIELPASGVIAREVKAKDPEEVNQEERVSGRITDLAVSAAGDQGTLTLEPGFQVTFTSAARFAADDSDLTFRQFVDRVKAALAQSPHLLLPMEAERAPTGPLVLAPSDPFPASQLDLPGAGGGPEIAINIAVANLVAAGSGDCQASLSATLKGCLKVLGLTVGIDATTELEAMLPGVIETRFEGLVDCTTLNVTGAREGSFTLVGQSTAIEVSATTRVEFESEEDAPVTDLGAVKTACGATPAQTVRAEGEGVAGMTAGTLLATEVQFEVEGQEEAAHGSVEFKGQVSAVDLDHRTVTVIGDVGTIAVHVASDSLIDHDSDLRTLQAVRDALAVTSPQQVLAEGVATVGAAGSTPEATAVKFEVGH